MRLTSAPDRHRAQWPIERSATIRRGRFANMVAKIAANGSGPARNGHPDEGGRGRAGRILAAAILLVALVYGAALVWLLLSSDRLAGEPVVHVALAPEALEAPAEPEDAAGEETISPPADILPGEPETTEGDVADL